MTKEEIITVSMIMLYADGGCSSCASDLMKQLAAEFPEHEETIKNTYLEQYKSKYSRKW